MKFKINYFILFICLKLHLFNSIKAFLQFKVNDINNIGFINISITCQIEQPNNIYIPFISNSIATHLFNVSSCLENKYNLNVYWPPNWEYKVIPVHCPQLDFNDISILYTLNITGLNGNIFGNCNKNGLNNERTEFLSTDEQFWNVSNLKETTKNANISKLIGKIFNLLNANYKKLDNWQILHQLQTIIYLMEIINPKKVIKIFMFQQNLHDHIASLAYSNKGNWENSSSIKQIVKDKIIININIEDYKNTLKDYKNVVDNLVKQNTDNLLNSELDLNVQLEPINESFQQPPQPSQEEIEARNIAATLQYEEIMNKRQEDQWRQQRYQQGEGGSSSQYQQFLHQGQGGGSHQYLLGYDPQYFPQYYHSHLPHGDVQPHVQQQRRSRSRSSSRHRFGLMQ